MSLQRLLEQATPGPWEVRRGHDEPHLSLWAGGFCIADDAFRYGTDATYSLAALAPDAVRLLTDMAEELAVLRYSRSSGSPARDAINALLARFAELDQRAAQ